MSTHPSFAARIQILRMHLSEFRARNARNPTTRAERETATSEYVAPGEQWVVKGPLTLSTYMGEVE